MNELDEDPASLRNGSGASLTARVARGAGWIIGGRFVMGMMGFVNTIIVARLLAPADFGLVAIGLTTMQILTNLSDIGVSQAVIRFHDADRKDIDTLFTLSAIRGFIVAGILAVIAPVAASFYHDPRVFWVFLGVAAYPLAVGFVNPRFYEYERALDYSKEFVLTTIYKFAGVIVSIIVAVVFKTYWAIILGLATNGLVQALLSYLMRPYRPRVSFASVRKILEFSGWLTGVAVMSALNNKLDPLILARAIGASGAGFYFVGRDLAELPTREIAFPASRAVYPGLAELQTDPARAKRAFLRSVEALAAIATPAAIGFALVAHDLVPLLFTEKWLPSVPIVEILTPVMGLEMPLIATQYFAMAVGSTRLVFMRELIYFLVRTPLVIWAAVTYGLLGVAAAVAALGLVHVALNLALYSQTSGDNPMRPIWRMHRSLLAAVAMAAILLAARASGFSPQEPILRLAAEVIVGVTAYGAIHILLWRLEGMPDGPERISLNAVSVLKARLRRS
ncbi:MAG: lipopolysaccharide biosynthesis protein [Parvularculaceae bacterium]